MEFGRQGSLAEGGGDGDRSGTTAPSFLSGGGRVGAMMRAHDWSRSSLGRPDRWPQSLRSVVGLMIDSQFPMFVAWGPDLALLYNDAYAEILGDKHPAALGGRLADIWPEIWPDISPLIAAALAGEASYREDLPLLMRRHGEDEQTWFTFSYSPVRDESGAVAGMFCACTETTGRIQLEATLREREARFREIADAVPAFIWFAAPNGELRYLSQRWYDFTGQAPTEALPNGWALLLHPDDMVRTAEAWAYARDHGTPYEVEIRHRGRDGAYRWFLARAEPVRDEAGRVTAWFGTTTDIHERKQMEAALRESEARLRALTDHLPGGMVYQVAVDAEGNRRFVHVSQSYERLTGVPAEQVLADPSVAYRSILPEDLPILQAAEEEVIRSRGTFDVQVRFHRQDGEQRWCRIISAPRDMGDGTTIWDGIQIDITDEKEAEAALREREARLRLALEAGRMAEVTFHVAEGTMSHGASFAELLGRPPEHALTLPELRAAYHPDDHQRVMDERVAILASDMKFYDVEKRIIRADGEIRHLYGRGRVFRNADGTARTVIAVYLDETERKLAEAALHRSEQAFRLIADALPVLISHIGPDQRYRFANRAYEDWFGTPSQDLIGRTIAEVVGEAAYAKTESLIRKGLVGERLSFEQQLPYQHGGTRYVHVDFVPAVDADGASNGYYALIQDVSDAKKSAEQLTELAATLEQRVRERTAELEQAYEQLRQSQKLEAMGQLTGGVAHDFNNLLTPIIGGLDMLQRRGLGGEREQRLIAGALQSAERAKTLVQRLLAFARRQPLQPTAVDVGELVGGMADLIASTSGPQIKLVVDVAAGLAPAKADPNQLEMAILNLSVNARDAMRDGGTLTIAAQEEVVGRGDRARLAPGRYVRLRISDTGAGMDEATLKRAVEPFFSTKGIGKGTGLGLSMVHGLAEQLGGMLNLSSRLGLGTCAELWLPVSSEAALADEPAAIIQPDGSRPGKVLLIDDDQMVRDSTAAMLVDLGYDVVEADCAEAALLILTDAADIDLLVTDHLMAGMTGADLARHVRGRTPDLPVMIVSGYAEAEAIAPDLPRLVKPFRQEELAAKLAGLRTG